MGYISKKVAAYGQFVLVFNKSTAVDMNHYVRLSVIMSFLAT